MLGKRVIRSDSFGTVAEYGTVVGVTLNNSKYCSAREIHVRMDGGELIKAYDWVNYPEMVRLTKDIHFL